MLSKEERAKYWSDGAAGYNEHIKREIDNDVEEAWYDLIIGQCKCDKPLKALDCGCGPGYFSILLAKRGHSVCGIDQAEGMLEKARENAANAGVNPDFSIMDVENTEFNDGEFDLILSRNVTWNLDRPELVYREWHRLLKPGGTLLIFDAEWFAYMFDREKEALVRKDYEDYAKKYNVERKFDPDPAKSHDHVDPRELPMTSRRRPDWDVTFLNYLGFSEVKAYEGISEKIWDERERLMYRSTPMFMVSAVK